MIVEEKDIFWALWQMGYACILGDKALLFKDSVSDDLMEYKVCVESYTYVSGRKGKRLNICSYGIDLAVLSKKYTSKQQYLTELANTFIKTNLS